MTRETKIGLLVGLAFIIVIGILLSEHISSTNEPPTANLVDAGNNVRDGVTTPADPQQPPMTASTNAPADAPRQRVPTRADLAPRKPTVAVAQRTPAPPPPAAVGQPSEPTPVDVDGNPGSVARGPQGQPPRDLMSAHPGEFAPVKPRDGTAERVAAAERPAMPPKLYAAEAGDSVSRMAARLLGGNTRANRELIIGANPTLQGDGNVVQVGKTYVIPAVASPKPAPALASAAKPASPGATHVEPAHGFVWYTVKENDNLWKIAAEQMGSGNAWASLKDFNKDILKGGENVRPNMRIRLPGKSVASTGAD